MRFSNQNTQTLESLLAALRGGLSAQTAYPILANTLEQQQAQNAARAEQLQQYGGAVAEMAQSGYPMAQATTMMDLATPQPGVPDRVQNLLDTAYPQELNYMGQQMDFPLGSRPESQALRSGGMGAKVAPGQMLSPLYLDNPMMQEPPLPPSDEQKLGELVTYLTGKQADGNTFPEMMVSLKNELGMEAYGTFLANQDKIMPYLSTQINPLHRWELDQAGYLEDAYDPRRQLPDSLRAMLGYTEEGQTAESQEPGVAMSNAGAGAVGLGSLLNSWIS